MYIVAFDIKIHAIYRKDKKDTNEKRKVKKSCVIIGISSNLKKRTKIAKNNKQLMKRFKVFFFFF